MEHWRPPTIIDPAIRSVRQVTGPLSDMQIHKIETRKTIPKTTRNLSGMKTA